MRGTGEADAFPFVWMTWDYGCQLVTGGFLAVCFCNRHVQWTRMVGKGLLNHSLWVLEECSLPALMVLRERLESSRKLSWVFANYLTSQPANSQSRKWRQALWIQQHCFARFQCCYLTNEPWKTCGSLKTRSKLYCLKEEMQHKFTQLTDSLCSLLKIEI